MTKITELTSLSEIKAKADELLQAVENAETVETRNKLEEELEECINHYTHISKGICYDKCKNSENPMITAILEFFFPVIKVKETKEQETGVVVRSIIDAERPIDLGDLHKKLRGVGADHNWIYMVEKLNYYLTLRAAKRMNVEVKADAYKLKEISRDIELGKNPLSNTNILKTLQTVVTAMLGDGYKATSHDVNYLVDVYSNDNKKSKTGITAANHKTLRNYMKKVCYRIVTGGKGYDVETREIKA